MKALAMKALVKVFAAMESAAVKGATAMKSAAVKGTTTVKDPSTAMEVAPAVPGIGR